MYEVLIPVDQNETRAFHQARYVTRLPNAAEDVAATVLYVVPPEEFSEADEVAFSEIDAAVEAANLLEDEEISVTRSVDDGGVPQEIIRTADELDVNEIVVGGRKRSGVTQVLLGSTVQDLMTSAERPVTITGENVVLGDGTRRVLIPVDQDEERAHHQVEYVSHLPGGTGSIETTVFFVFPHQDYKGSPPHEFEEVDAAVRTAEELDHQGFAVERVATGGEVAETILETAEELEADSIVMAGRKRSGVMNVLLGSTTQDVLLSADRPLTVTG